MASETFRFETRGFQELSNEQIADTIHERVFFYGSLRVGGRLHAAMLDSIAAVFAQTGYIRGEVKPTIYWFPCLLEGLGLVEGEVWTTDAAGLRWLDYVENAPELYERRKVRLVNPDGTDGFEVWVYFGTGAKNLIQDATQS